MDYTDKYFIKIDGDEYPLKEIERTYEQDIQQKKSISYDHIRQINQLESYYIPELTTIWLDKTTRDDLIDKLKTNSVTVEGLVVSPYYEYTGEKEFYPRLLSEEERGNGDIYQLTFELEDI